MPTSNETIPNKALSGAELKAIMKEKFAHLLSNDSMLSDHLAYGRISYDITIRLDFDNPYYAMPIVNTIASSPVGKNIVKSAPELEAIESGPPLKAPHTDKRMSSGTKIRHEINNPNKERLAHGMSVPVDVKRNDGSIRTESIDYPRQMLSDKGLGQSNVVVTDISEQTRRELGVK